MASYSAHRAISQTQSAEKQDLAAASLFRARENLPEEDRTSLNCYGVPHPLKICKSLCTKSFGFEIRNATYTLCVFVGNAECSAQSVEIILSGFSPVKALNFKRLLLRVVSANYRYFMAVRGTVG